MKRQILLVGLMAVAVTIGANPARAGQRSSNGDTTGSAVPRDSGGGSAAPSPAPSGGGASSSGGGWSEPMRAAPSPAADSGEQRRRGGDGSSSGRAVPRGGAGSGGSTASSEGSGHRGEGRGRESVPTYSRPRDGREPQGTAVERRAGRPGGGGGGGAYYPGIFYDPYYSNVYYYDPYYGGPYYGRYSSYWAPYGYGFGLGYFAYDPYLFGGYYDPYQGGYGQGPYGQGGYGAGGYRGAGAMRLRVKPSNAQVYVDGYYVGLVDSFDGSFQRLSVEDGPHKIEVRAEGYEPVQFDVMIVAGETVTYKGELKRIH